MHSAAEDIIELDREAESLEEIRIANEGAEVPDPVYAGSKEQRDIPEYTSDEHILGSPDARFTLVWYTSLSSRLSSLIYPEIIQFISDHPEINLVMRHFPLADRKLDWAISRIAECVATENGNEAYWEYISLLFDLPRITSTIAKETAVNLNLAEERVKECFDDEESMEIHGQVFLDKQHAWMMGKITSSPTLVFVDNDAKKMWFIERAETREFMERVWEAIQSSF